MRRRLPLYALLAAGLVWFIASWRSVETDDAWVVRHGLFTEARLVDAGWHFVPRGFNRLLRYGQADEEVVLEDPGVAWISPEGAELDFKARLSCRNLGPRVLQRHAAYPGRTLEQVVRSELASVLAAVSAMDDPPPAGSSTFRRLVESRLGEALADAGVSLQTMEDVEDLPGGMQPIPPARRPERRVMLVGLDGADWDILDPLIDRGQMPNLARLVRDGARARLRTISPILSPVVWTSVATGKSPAKHGIVDFLAQAPDGSRVPVTSTLREAKAIWNLLGDSGIPVAVTAWWATWPAEPVRGLMATDRISYQLFRDVIEESADDPVAERRGKTWPATLFEEIRPLIVPPAAITEADVAVYVDLAALEPRDEDDEDRLEELRTILASTRSYEAIGLALLERQPTGFHAIYNESTDTAAHLFMPFRPPAPERLDARRRRAFGGVVDAVYREADAMIGRVLARLDDSWNVIVLSDHGFKHGDNRPRSDPRIDRGPGADWHDRFGMLVMHGPDIRKGARVADASILDVAPTLLALYGLPVGEDMDGRVLEEALEEGFLVSVPVTRVATWERGRGAVRAVAPSAQDPELMERLRSLGYISGPGPGDGDGGVGDFAQDSARAFSNRGVIYLAERDLDAALAEFEKAEAAGGGAQARINIATVWLLKRDLPEARAAVAKVREAGDPRRSLLVLEGWLYDLEGDEPRAERLLEEAIRLEPSDTRARTRLGHVLEEQGRLDEAIEQYLAAVAADPHNAEARSYAGALLIGRGELGEAERLLREAIDADPRYAGSYNNLGLLLQQQGKVDEALALYRKGLRYAPQSALLHNSLAGALILAGSNQEAESAARKAIELAPKMPEGHNNLGILLAEAGRPAEAKAAFEAALAADPGNPDALFNRGKLALIEGRHEDALSDFRAVLERAPAHLDAAIGAGETAYRLGRSDQALDAFAHALRIEERLPRVHRRLGELWLARGETARAREAWARALELRPDPELRRRLDALGVRSNP